MNEWIKEKEVPLGELFYLLSFAPLLIAKGVGLYDGQKIFTCFAAVSLAFGIGKLLITKYSAKDIFIISGLLILSLIVYRKSNEKGILFYVWMIVGMKNVRLKEVMRWGLKIWSAAFGFIIIYSLFNLHDTSYKVHSKLGMGHMFRWSLGYPHPNVLHISFLILLLFIVYHIKERFNWKICLFMFLGNCYIFMYSVSYTGFAIVVLYLAGTMYWKYRGRLSKPEQVICEGVFPACVFLSIAAPLLLTGRAFDIINKLLNTRLYLSGLFLTKENITLFGNNIGRMTTATKTMDNSYVYGLTAYGIIFFVLISAGYILLIHRYVRMQKGMELLIIFAVLAAGLTEPFLFNTSYKNITMLFLGEMIFAHNKSGKTSWENTVIKVKAIRFSALCDALTDNGHKKKVYFALLSAIIGMACVVIYTKNTEDYKGAIVPRVHCADIEEKETYIDQKSLESYSDYLILDYKDGNAPVEIFQGEIMKIELYRAAVSFGIMGFIISYIILNVLFYVYSRRAKVSNEK